MPEPRVLPNETTVPLLPCAFVDETLEFYEALGFEVTYRMAKPYLYLAFRFSGIDLHFGAAPKAYDPAREDGGGCLVLVDAVAPYHAAFSAALRAKYGKVLSTGQPRITRYRPGASRFTVIDPSGNSLIFIQRDEPMELEYGGAAGLSGLAKALDNARILQEFKGDDRAALRAITSGLRRHRDGATALDQALAFANLIELATELNEPEPIEGWLTEIRSIPLSDAEWQRLADELPAVVSRVRSSR